MKNHLQCRRSGFDPWVGKIPLEEGMATHSSLLAWRSPRTKKPGGLQPTGSQESDKEVESVWLFMAWPRKSQPPLMPHLTSETSVNILPSMALVHRVGHD